MVLISGILTKKYMGYSIGAKIIYYESKSKKRWVLYGS